MADAHADEVVSRALRRGAGQRAGILIVLGLVLAAPFCLIGMNILNTLAQPRAEAFGTMPGPGAGELVWKRSDTVLMSVLGLVAAAGAAIVAIGIRRRGPRGTRVGRTVLDSPEHVFSVRYFPREIRAGGVVVRTVHVVSISIDAGDELEVHLAPNEVPAVLEALRARVGAHAMATGTEPLGSG